MITLLACPHCKAELELDFTLFVNRLAAARSEAWRRVPLKEMELSVRAYNALNHETWNGTAWEKDGPRTAGEIDDKSDSELLRFPNFGRRSLREVREVLAHLKALPQEPHR